jgi:hypothetical protein
MIGRAGGTPSNACLNVIEVRFIERFYPIIRIERQGAKTRREDRQEAKEFVIRAGLPTGVILSASEGPLVPRAAGVETRQAFDLERETLRSTSG